MNVAPGRSVSACLNALRTISGAASRSVHHVAPLRDRAEQRYEVDHLVRLLVEPVQPGLRRERHQRVRVELGVRDPEDEVERAGAERREADARLAGQRAVGVGHERGTALVPGRHEADRAVRQRVDDVQVLLAREPEDVLDAFVLETGDEELRDGAFVRTGSHRQPTFALFHPRR